MGIVVIGCNCKEVPVNQIIQSRTHNYSSRNPEHVTISMLSGDVAAVDETFREYFRDGA
jgi:hypothetical protein